MTEAARAVAPTAPRRPAFQFYPSDWRTDPGLRLCTVPARGLWMEMLCLMHDGTPYGTLTAGGRPISDIALARLVGESADDVTRWRGELEDNGVYSVDAGIIFSRRMIRDEALRNLRAANGQLGADHGHKGAEHGAKGGRPRKAKPAKAENEKPPIPQNSRGVTKPAPSSSSPSPSSSPSEEGSGLSGENLSEVGDTRAGACANGGAA
jgi:hypothetical protein